MKCPHCYSQLQKDAAFCHACGFSSAAIKAILGADWVRLQRITDNSKRLSLREERQMEVALDDFERAFPQCFMAIYLGPVSAPLTVTDLGFWMINHGAFHTHVMMKRNDFGVALVVDTLQHRAGFSVGYALERALGQTVLLGILKEMRKGLERGQLAATLRRAVLLVGRELQRHAESRHLPPEDAPPPGGGAQQMGFEPLRHVLHGESKRGHLSDG